MRIFVPKELSSGERRIPLMPANAEKLVMLGAELDIEAGLGSSIGIPDDEYSKAGASVIQNRHQSLSEADIVLRLRKPPLEEIRLLKRGSLHVGFLDPFNERDLIQAMTGAGVSAVSMELIPRTTAAQKMDALSSQASLAGYVSVILAAERLDQIFPMMMTPAGTLSPAKVFVIGAGVAGLQAIATAKRLGAVVEAFDTRPVVEEQVKSLGGKYVKVDLGETGQTQQGYAKALTEEQLQKQRDIMAKHCAASDIVITTAQIFGRAAPLIVTKSMIAGMRSGSVVVDMAVETGGNVEGSRLDEEIMLNDVRIIGLGNLSGHVPVHSSQMYSSNLYNFIEHFWNKNLKLFELKLNDDIIKGCLVTHAGQIVNETIRKLYS